MKHTYKPLLALLTFLVVGVGTLWASGTRDDYTNSYFTVESLADNDTIKILIPPGITPEHMTSVSYSTDGTEWTTTMVDNTDQRITVILNQGEKVHFKGLGRQLGTADPYACCLIRGTAEHVFYGNIMSLLYGDDFASQTAFPEGSSDNFHALFYYDPFLVSAENLVMPATTLANGCYKYMFNACTSLTTAPELPATTLAAKCYESMFEGCTSLATAPALPATIMSSRCYYKMFYGCTSLTTAPTLPATTLASYCYCYMFMYCSSLTEAPKLPATQMEYACYAALFACCTSLAEAPKLPATELSGTCYYAMFASCHSLTEAPELPATTLTKNCYGWMFNDCPSLTKSPVLPAPVLVDSCYQYMFYYSPSIEEITCLATDISATDCVENWTLDVAPTGTFYKAPGMEGWPLDSSSGVPVGWTVAEYNGLDESQAPVAVYPNPVTDKLHITGADLQSVRLFDPQGRLLRTEACGPADHLQLDLQGYAPGVYTVSILSKGETLTRKVVVK